MRARNGQAVPRKEELRVVRVEGKGLIQEILDRLPRPRAIHPVEDARFEHHGLRVIGLQVQHFIQARSRPSELLHDAVAIPVTGPLFLLQASNLVPPQVLRPSVTTGAVREVDLLEEVPDFVVAGKACLSLHDGGLGFLELLRFQRPLGAGEDACGLVLRHKETME
jgi:hypothetical protein